MVPDVIFLDRDGVIVNNEDNYLRRVADVKFIPRSLDALALMHEAYPLTRMVIVTNQSAVGRGYMTIQQCWNIHYHIVERIKEAGGCIYDSYICPHHPDINCFCRKPKEGLISIALKSYKFQKPWMIGDYHTDILAGLRAGCRCVQVMTGRGTDDCIGIDTRARDLYDAIGLILNANE